MSQKLCKKCQRPLPEGYKYNYCERCRGLRADGAKDVGKKALGCVALAGSFAIAIITKGKINPTKK